MMKTCRHCAERIQGHAKICRFCGADQPAERTGTSLVTALALTAVAVVLIATLRPDQTPPEPAAAAFYSTERIGQCSALLADARRQRLVRAQPTGERIDVDERRWALFPAASKTGILLALACQRYGRPMIGVEGVVAYGYHSGKRVATATQVGVSYE